jgi:hypothetical protein
MPCPLQPGLFILIQEPVILPIHVKDDGMMDQPADQGCRHMLIIAKERNPFRELKI